MITYYKPIRKDTQKINIPPYGAADNSKKIFDSAAKTNRKNDYFCASPF
jgi:hypothetical protein